MIESINPDLTIKSTTKIETRLFIMNVTEETSTGINLRMSSVEDHFIIPINGNKWIVKKFALDNPIFDERYATGEITYCCKTRQVEGRVVYTLKDRDNAEVLASTANYLVVERVVNDIIANKEHDEFGFWGSEAFNKLQAIQDQSKQIMDLTDWYHNRFLIKR